MLFHFVTYMPCHSPIRWQENIIVLFNGFRINTVIQPTSQQKLMLDILVKMSSSNPMKPVLVSENGQMVYYKPIKIAMPACLNCHGSAGKEIDTKTLEIITQKYPDDMATGYKEGDLRGLWKITFLKNNVVNSLLNFISFNNYKSITADKSLRPGRQDRNPK